jgi:hypothetical protein
MARDVEAKPISQIARTQPANKMITAIGRGVRSHARAAMPGTAGASPI